MIPEISMDEKNRLVDEALEKAGLTRADLTDEQHQKIAKSLSLSTYELAKIGATAYQSEVDGIELEDGYLGDMADDFLNQRVKH